MGWFNHQIGVLKKAISYEPMQVCQADHNIVYTALGEEEIDFGPRDSEANIIESLSFGWVSYGFPKMVGFPNNHGVFLLKLIIFGVVLGVPPFKETPI